MNKVECTSDLVARERRGLTSAAERIALDAHVVSCESCRLTRQVGADFDETGLLRPGDYEQIARIVTAAARKTSGRQRTWWSRKRRWPLLLAAAALIAGGGAAATRLWPSPPVTAIPTPIEDAKAPGRTLPVPRSAWTQQSRPGDVDDIEAAETQPSKPPRATQPASSTLERADPEVSAQALFAQANEARRSGNADGAGALYRQLQRRFPASAEARLSHVSLGRLLMGNGAMADALAQFDRYLVSSHGGALTAEALYGRAQALAALGRAREEQQTWQRLRREFPGSPYAEKAPKHASDSD